MVLLDLTTQQEATMASVSRGLERIKGDLEFYLTPASITAACVAAGQTWRERKLGPLATVHLSALAGLASP
jgi:hypothetical protein